MQSRTRMAGLARTLNHCTYRPRLRPRLSKKDGAPQPGPRHATTRHRSSPAVPTGSPAPTPSNEEVNFQYMTPIALHATERPFQLLRPVDANARDRRLSNCEWEAGPTETVLDIRGMEGEPGLERQGFMVRKAGTALGPEDFADGDLVETFYMPEMEALLRREVEGADLVVGFEHQVRTSP